MSASFLEAAAGAALTLSASLDEILQGQKALRAELAEKLDELTRRVGEIEYSKECRRAEIAAVRAQQDEIHRQLSALAQVIEKIAGGAASQ